MRYRVYFNKSSEFPHVFSVDEGSHASEVCVQSVEVKVPGVMQYDGTKEYPEPKAWLEVDGQLKLVAGKAIIEEIH